jgi:hypothetical protein
MEWGFSHEAGRSIRVLAEVATGIHPGVIWRGLFFFQKSCCAYFLSKEPVREDGIPAIFFRSKEELL